jgi:hypothetical protein
VKLVKHRKSSQGSLSSEASKAQKIKSRQSFK